LRPLKPAEDARLLDNSDLTVEESVNQVLDWWQGKQPFKVYRNRLKRLAFVGPSPPLSRSSALVVWFNNLTPRQNRELTCG
jgi:hypothetical protein